MPAPRLKLVTMPAYCPPLTTVPTEASAMLAEAETEVTVDGPSTESNPRGETPHAPHALIDTSVVVP
jgi:hypothetical protein